MEQITIRIKDSKKARTLLEFLKSLDFVESVMEKELTVEKKSNDQRDEDFFGLAGLWTGRDISLQTIRADSFRYWKTTR